VLTQEVVQKIQELLPSTQLSREPAKDTWTIQGHGYTVELSSSKREGELKRSRLVYTWSDHITGDVIARSSMDSISRIYRSVGRAGVSTVVFEEATQDATALLVLYPNGSTESFAINQT